MYYPEGMKARVSPVQSIEPHRILAPTRDSNQEPLGPQFRVVTTILALHTCGDRYTTTAHIMVHYSKNSENEGIRGAAEDEIYG